MPEHDAIRTYLETVGEQIRWSRARRGVLPELQKHLEDQRDAFAAEGLEDPEQAAVEEMGDPVSVGTELDRIHRPRPQWGLLTLTVAIALCGAVLRVWLTADWADTYQNIDPLRTALALGLGCGALLAGYFLDISFLGHYARAIYVGALAAAIGGCLVSPRVAGVAFYARYVVLCFPVIYACWLYHCRGRGWRGLVLAVSGGFPLAALCCVIPYGFALVQLLLTGFLLLVMACWKDWFGIGRWKSVLGFLGCAGAAAGAVGYLIFQPLARRLTLVLHPERDPLGMGYYGLSIRRVLDVSQWWGQGTWDGPYPYEMTVQGCDSDNLLTTLIYRLGWLPALLAILALAILVGWLVCRSLRLRGQLGYFLVSTVAMMLGIQAIFSIAWNLGFTLQSAFFPLLIGNVCTVIDMGFIGLALSAFRGDSILRDQAGKAEYRPRYRIRVSIQKL